MLLVRHFQGTLVSMAQSGPSGVGPEAGVALDGPDWAIDTAPGCLYNSDMNARQQINFRLSPDERDGVAAAAEAMGMNQSEYLKSAALHCRHCAAFAEEFKRPRVSGRRGFRRLLRRPGGDDGVTK